MLKFLAIIKEPIFFSSFVFQVPRDGSSFRHCFANFFRFLYLFFTPRQRYATFVLFLYVYKDLNRCLTYSKRFMIS